MQTHKLNGLSVLQSELLLAAGVPHGWFGSSLGNTIFRPENPFSDPQWIDESAMRQRRQQACAVLGLDGRRVVVTTGLLQTDIVQTVQAAHAGKKVGPADGYLTHTPGLPLVLAAADCAQIIVYAPDVQAMAVVHAGGLGAARGVLTKATKQLISVHGAAPGGMIAAIGPSLSAAHFAPTREGDNFTLADIAHTKPVTKKLANGRIGYDIAATLARQLQDLGVLPARIEVSTIDTFASADWYSYARDKGHNMAAAMRRNGLFVALPARHPA